MNTKDDALTIDKELIDLGYRIINPKTIKQTTDAHVSCYNVGVCFKIRDVLSHRKFPDTQIMELAKKKGYTEKYPIIAQGERYSDLYGAMLVLRVPYTILGGIKISFPLDFPNWGEVLSHLYESIYYLLYLYLVDVDVYVFKCSLGEGTAIFCEKRHLKSLIEEYGAYTIMNSTGYKVNFEVVDSTEARKLKKLIFSHVEQWKKQRIRKVKFNKNTTYLSDNIGFSKYISIQSDTSNDPSISSIMEELGRNKITKVKEVTQEEITTQIQIAKNILSLLYIK